MDNKISNIKERILYLIKYHGDTREEFFKKIGMSYANFKGEAKKTPLNSDSIVNILSIYKDISPEWLLIGKEPMLREGEQVKVKSVDIDNEHFKELLKQNREFYAECERLKEKNAQLRKELDTLTERKKNRPTTKTTINQQ